VFNLSLYYKSIYKYGELFNLNTYKSIELFFNEQIKIDTKTTTSKTLFEFYRSYEDYMLKMKLVLGYIKLLNN
jgi:hypothetical protein